MPTEQEKRTKPVKVYFTPTEYAAVVAAAGWTPTGVLVRELVLDWVRAREQERLSA